MSRPSFVSSVSFLFLIVLLLPASHGTSSYASYKLGSRQVFFKTSGKSSGNSQQASTVPPDATTCSSIATTGPGNNKLPVVHRQSPCSPLYGLPSLTTADVLRRDTSLIRRRFSSQSSSVMDAQAPSPAAVIIPTNSSSSTPPGTLDYSVVVSYGTPEQQFPMFLDNGFGTTLLRCKPCASGSDDCDPAFDTSRSSTFAHVLCGSPDCPTNCTDGSVCPYYGQLDEVNGDGTYVEDVLTLAPSMAVHNFTFVCLDVDGPSHDTPEAGTLDLSRSRNSLPSRLSSSSPWWLAPGPAATFSYCLPQSPNSQGFLVLGGNATVGSDDFNLTSYAPLVNGSSSYPELSSMYFIDVVGLNLGGVDLPLPAGTFGGGNARTTVDMGTTFTWLVPDAYNALRDAFMEQMSQYNNISMSDLLVPGFAGFDICFNFTGLDQLTVPALNFVFSNGEFLGIGDPMLYFDDPAHGPFGMTCLAYSSLDAGVDIFSAIIGTYTLTSTEVIYDVAGGKVGFVPYSC